MASETQQQTNTHHLLASFWENRRKPHCMDATERPIHFWFEEPTRCFFPNSWKLWGFCPQSSGVAAFSSGGFRLVPPLIGISPAFMLIKHIVLPNTKTKQNKLMACWGYISWASSFFFFFPSGASAVGAGQNVGVDPHRLAFLGEPRLGGRHLRQAELQGTQVLAKSCARRPGRRHVHGGNPKEHH